MATIKNMSAKNSQMNYEIDLSVEFSQKLHSQKRASCSKSIAGLLLCCHQADIRMRSHRLLRLDDNKSAASCQQS